MSSRWSCPGPLASIASSALIDDVDQALLEILRVEPRHGQLGVGNIGDRHPWARLSNRIRDRALRITSLTFTHLYSAVAGRAMIQHASENLRDPSHVVVHDVEHSSFCSGSVHFLLRYCTTDERLVSGLPISWAMPAAICPRATIFSRWAIRIRDIFQHLVDGRDLFGPVEQIGFQLLVLGQVLPDDDMPERRAVQSRDRVASDLDESLGPGRPCRNRSARRPARHCPETPAGS